MRTREATLPKPPSAFSTRRADTERLGAQLAEWTAVIAQYRANALRATAEGRVEFDRRADELQRLRNQAGTQVLLLKDASDQDWAALVGDLDRSWNSLRSTFQKATTGGRDQEIVRVALRGS
jgi:hypothetical protein